ncbi:MAG: hypothetical protein FJZ78_10575 [Bacteroidetes bacterium]|nr:hypothetical protein [Bacteroidota bacterium]
MRQLVLACLLLLVIHHGYGQYQQPDSEALEQLNGFKTIKLNTPVDSVKGAVFRKSLLEKKLFEANLYQVSDENLNTIGGVRVDRIQIKSYKNLVYQIEVLTDKNPELMKGLERALGKPSFSVRTNLYSWRAKSLYLTFGTYGKNQIRLVYHSYPVYKMMAGEKGKRIEEIAEDF